MRNLVTAILIAATVLVARAQSGLDGKWNFEMNSQMGSVSAKVDLKVDGTRLTGQFDMGGGRVWPVENGVVDGDRLTFTINRDGRMTYEMKGKLEGDKISGAAGAMGTTVDWTMARAK